MNKQPAESFDNDADLHHNCNSNALANREAVLEIIS